MKKTIWLKIKGWLVIKPALRKETIGTLKAFAIGLPEEKMTLRYKEFQYFAKEILKDYEK